MNTDRLRAFKCVVDRGSFSAAAKELGVTQPAVSMSVRALEEEFGQPLLIRDGERIAMTPAGQAVYDKAAAILVLLDQARAEVAALQRQVQGRLAIGASTIPAEYILPAMIRDFRRLHPQVEISLEVGDTAEITARVNARALDLAVVGAPPEDKELESFAVERDELCLIAPVAEPWLHLQRVGREHLLGADFVFRQSGSGTRRSMEEALLACGLKPHEVRTAGAFGSNETVIAAVEAGLGLSFVSSWAARRAEQAGRVRVLESTCGAVQRYFYAIVPPGRSGEGSAARAFAEHLRAVAAERGVQG